MTTATFLAGISLTSHDVHCWSVLAAQADVSQISADVGS